MCKIRTMVVEDDVDWINAIKDYLYNENDIFIESTATDKESAVRLAEKTHPDVIVMDINLNGNKCDGIYAAAEIKCLTDAKVVMLTSLNGDDIVRDSFVAGAVNFLPKGNFTGLADAIRSAKADDSPYNVALKELLRLKRGELLSCLTESEKEILALLEKGHSRSQIVNITIKSENTVKTQIKSILRKMNEKTVEDLRRKIKLMGFK